MPSTFPEVWLSRVVMLITSLVSAPWLDGIPELDTEVLEVGSGSASEQNLIHIPIENFEVDCLINNTAYPIALQAYTDTEAVVALDKYQTKVTTLSDDQIDGAAYSKIDSATRGHVRSMRTNKFKRAIHSLAPNLNTASTPVLVTTGAEVTPGGRKRFVYADLVRLKDSLDQADCPEEGRRLVLSTDHMNDLLLDRDRFADKLVNHTSGKAAPIICGFEIYSYLGNPYYFEDTDNDDVLTKLAFGEIPDPATDFRASIVFLADNVGKKTGKTKQYFASAEKDPETQTNKLNYRHYFIAVPVQMKYMAAII